MTFASFPTGAPTADVVAALERDGAVILRDRTARMDDVARELGPWLDRPVEASPIDRNAFTGLGTLRTSGLIAKSPACRALVEDADVLALCDAVLGPQCARFQLSFTQAIAIGPGLSACRRPPRATTVALRAPSDVRPMLARHVLQHVPRCASGVRPNAPRIARSRLALLVGARSRAQAIHRDSTMYPFRRPGAKCSSTRSGR